MHAHPWCGKGPRVLDKRGNINTIAICRKLPPLYHVELFSMRRAVIIDKRPCRNSDGVNNEGVAIFIMANRFTVPRRFNIFRMKRIQIDVPNLRSARAQQLTEAFGWKDAPRYLIRDRDCAYGDAFIRRVGAMGIRDRPVSARSPWQNGYVERLIGSIRRDCLDHMVIFGERHLRHLLHLYQKYYNDESYCLSLYVIDSKRLDC